MTTQEASPSVGGRGGVPTSPLTQLRAKELFTSNAFFLLSSLPPHSQFSIDSTAWTVNRFAGIKLVPPGWHLITWAAGPALKVSGVGDDQGEAEMEDDEPTRPGDQRQQEVDVGRTGVRSGMWKLFKPGDVVTRVYDPSVEDVPLPTPRVPAPNGRGTLLHLPTELSTDETLVSQDHLKSLDPQLAAYPFDAHSAWLSLTTFIDEQCLGRVIGFEPETGDARVDALMADEGEGDEATMVRAGLGRDTSSASSTWRSREAKMETAERVMEEDLMKKRASTEHHHKRAKLPSAAADVARQERLHFTYFNLKRSWRHGAIGEEVTKYSQDKSWLLSDVLKRLGGSEQLLAELQLSFLLFTLLHNFASLEVYKRILCLLTRSSEFLRPQGIGSLESLPPSEPCRRNAEANALPFHAPEAPDDRSRLSLYVSLINVLRSQLAFLRPEFFIEDMPGLEAFYLEELDSLRRNLWEALSRNFEKDDGEGDAAEDGSKDVARASSSLQQQYPSSLRRDLCRCWDELAQAANERFKWALQSVGGDVGSAFAGRTYGQEEEEEEEEGEYAPQVVIDP